MVWEVIPINSEYQSIVDWFPICHYQDNTIQLKNKKEVSVYQVNPVNFKLKTELEQEQILETFHRLLKKEFSSMQIIIQTDRKNLEKHFSKLLQIKTEKPFLANMIEDYIAFLGKMVKQRESVERKFFVILPAKAYSENQLIDSFEEMGNDIKRVDEEELEKMLARCFKKCTSMRKDAKWV